jgi:predicted TIM-barrel enzyme
MPKILPVIHHLDVETSLAQAELARAAACDGVWLICHNHRDPEVLQAAARLKHRWSQALDSERLFIGVNLLYTNNANALEFAHQLRLDGVWLDAPGVNSHGANERAKRLAETMRERFPAVPVFGSVAFKYQEHEPDPAEAARQAKALGMIPTTSGEATGIAPDLAKIEAMSAASKGLLAVASGMTPSNVAQYAPFLSHILVATGVSRGEHEFDPARLTAFVAAVRGSTAEPS